MTAMRGGLDGAPVTRPRAHIGAVRTHPYSVGYGKTYAAWCLKNLYKNFNNPRERELKKFAMILFSAITMIGAADAKTLVVYYSRTGNTAAVAQAIQNATGGDIFEIKTSDANHYPDEYRATTDMAQSEIENGNFPDIAAAPDMTEYDTIFIGSPCWWGTMAGPVHTFLTTVDTSGKTVIPFNTHGGSGAGTVHTDIEKLTPNANHKKGIAIYGSSAKNAGDEIAQWLTEIEAK